MPPRNDPLADDPCAITLQGVDYFLPWDDLPVGGSFFLPTTMRAQQVAPELTRKARQRGQIATAKQWCEFGVFGVRVWRVS